MLAAYTCMSKILTSGVNWTRPMEILVDAIIALWLFDIFFRPMRNRLRLGKTK